MSPGAQTVSLDTCSYHFNLGTTAERALEHQVALREFQAALRCGWTVHHDQQNDVATRKRAAEFLVLCSSNIGKTSSILNHHQQALGSYDWAVRYFHNDQVKRQWFPDGNPIDSVFPTILEGFASALRASGYHNSADCVLDWANETSTSRVGFGSLTKDVVPGDECRVAPVAGGLYDGVPEPEPSAQKLVYSCEDLRRLRPSRAKTRALAKSDGPNLTHLEPSSEKPPGPRPQRGNACDSRTEVAADEISGSVERVVADEETLGIVAPDEAISCQERSAELPSELPPTTACEEIPDNVKDSEHASEEASPEIHLRRPISDVNISTSTVADGPDNRQNTTDQPPKTNHPVDLPPAKPRPSDSKLVYSKEELLSLRSAALVGITATPEPIFVIPGTAAKGKSSKKKKPSKKKKQQPKVQHNQIEASTETPTVDALVHRAFGTNVDESTIRSGGGVALLDGVAVAPSHTEPDCPCHESCTLTGWADSELRVLWTNELLEEVLADIPLMQQSGVVWSALAIDGRDRASRLLCRSTLLDKFCDEIANGDQTVSHSVVCAQFLFGGGVRVPVLGDEEADQLRNLGMGHIIVVDVHRIARLGKVQVPEGGISLCDKGASRVFVI